MYCIAHNQLELQHQVLHYGPPLLTWFKFNPIPKSGLKLLIHFQTMQSLVEVWEWISNFTLHFRF